MKEKRFSAPADGWMEEGPRSGENGERGLV